MGCEVTVFNREKTQADLPPEVNHIRGERSTDRIKVSLSVWLPSAGYDSLHRARRIGYYEHVLRALPSALSCMDVYHDTGVILLNLVPLSQFRLQKIRCSVRLYILSGMPKRPNSRL